MIDILSYLFSYLFCDFILVILRKRHLDIVYKFSLLLVLLKGFAAVFSIEVQTPLSVYQLL